MRLVLAALAGALAGFALVFLGQPGLVLGLISVAALVILALIRRDGSVPGVAMAAGGAVVTLLAGRIVLTAFGDPAIVYQIENVWLMLGGAITAVIGALAALVAWDRRSRSSGDESAPRTGPNTPG